MPQNPPIIFGPHACGSVTREWLVADGLGGYATGTVGGLRTRRYHALLIVADPRSAVRRVALAALDLTVTLPSGAKIPLFAHEWASGAVSPQGHRHLETFALVDGLPRWRWRIGDVVVVEDAYRIAGPGWQPAGEWHLGARLRAEAAARGLADTEDLWHAGTYFDRVNSGGTLEISAWAGAPAPGRPTRPR